MSASTSTRSCPRCQTVCPDYHSPDSKDCSDNCITRHLAEIAALRLQVADLDTQLKLGRMDAQLVEAYIARLTEERDAARKDANYHHDCRPNRRQAEAAIADAKAVNDRMADEIKARRELEAQVAQLQQAMARLQCFSCGARIAGPLSESTKEQGLENARQFDAGEMDRTWQTNLQRLPFWRKGQCFMCQPLRDALAPAVAPSGSPQPEGKEPI